MKENLRFERRRGATRCVFLVRGIAIKVPSCETWVTFLWGLLANIQEKTLWKWPSRRPMLARVLYADPWGLCLVMERADEVFSDFSDKAVYESAEKLDHFFDLCEEKQLPVDRHYSNIGRFGDELKLIDYGGKL